jgi:hypothetical protein
MLAYLRARALSKGFLGGSRFWIGLGFVVWTIRFFQWLGRRETEVVYREALGAGHSVTIRHSPEVESRRQRRKTEKQARLDQEALRKQAKRDKRAARRRGGAAPAEAA